MNKQSKSLGKRSTNTASLSNAISSIKSSISPVIGTGSISGHPKALKGSKEFWIPRTVRIFQTATSTGNFVVSPSLSSVFSGAGITGQIRILRMKVWNFSNQNDNTNYIKVDVPSGLTETTVSTTVEDIGNASHLPGVSVEIPRTIAANLVTSSTAGSLAVITALPTGITLTTGNQSICIDVHFEYKTDTTN